MPRTVRIVLIVLAVIFAGIQFVPVERSNPAATAPIAPPPDVHAILVRSCFDCHSNETRWPWYARMAPASWFLADHVKEGRASLNFSYWNALPAGKQRHAAEEIREITAAGAMPLRSYLVVHRDARLSAADVRTLGEWFSGPAFTTTGPGTGSGAGEHEEEDDWHEGDPRRW